MKLPLRSPMLALLFCLLGPSCLGSAIGTGLITNEEGQNSAQVVSDLASSASDSLHRLAYSIPDDEPLRAQSSDIKEEIARKVASTFEKREPLAAVQKLQPRSSTNIRCVAEPADAPKTSDSKVAAVAKPLESNTYKQTVPLTTGKESGPTLSLLPIRLSFTNLPELSFLKRSPLSQATGTTVAASEERKTQENKARIVLPDNLFIPLDIGLAIRNMGVSLQKAPKLNAEPQKNVYSYQQAQSLQPKSPYSHAKSTKYVSKKNADKPGYRPYPKYYDYPKYPGKSYDDKPYGDKYSESGESHYLPHHSSSSYSSESRPNLEKTKVEEDQKGCRTVIKEIQEVPGRAKRGANEPRVIIMTKECYHPDNQAASVKIPDVKYGDYQKSYYPVSRTTDRPGVGHYQPTQNRPSYAYNSQNAHPYPANYDGYSFKDPYQYDGSSVYPHSQYYRSYPAYSFYPYGERRSSDHQDNRGEESSHYNRQEDGESGRSRHPEEYKEEEYKAHSENRPETSQSHRSPGFHQEPAQRTKPTPKTVTRSFAYYRKDNDDGKDPHNHEENEEYAQGNFRSYSTSYDSDRDGPK